MLRPDGTCTIGRGPALQAGAIRLACASITGVVSGDLLPSTGFAAMQSVTPDRSNFHAAAVHEPASVALLLAGLAHRPGACAQRRRTDTLTGGQPRPTC